MKQTLIILGFFLLFSCGNKTTYTKHEKGFEYLFYTHNEDATKPKVNDVMVLNMDYYFNDDSLLFSSSELSTPFRMKLKRSVPTGETIDDALSLLHIGDSASFKINANLFYTITKKVDVPLNVKLSDQITFYVKLKEIISYEKFQNQKIKPRNDTPKDEQRLLKRYIEMSNITVEPTHSGLYFIEDIKGKGEKPKIGDKITLNYSGYYVNGESFTSTYESGKPSVFTLGKDDLIPGFQEGISMMQKGGHYTLIIPSYLAYGEMGNELIAPNKTLIFEIDILDIR